MKWAYLGVWLWLAWREALPMWRDKRRRELAVWLAVACVGLWLGVWCFWLDTHWRLAEWAVW